MYFKILPSLRLPQYNFKRSVIRTAAFRNQFAVSSEIIKVDQSDRRLTTVNAVCCINQMLFSSDNISFYRATPCF